MSVQHGNTCHLICFTLTPDDFTHQWGKCLGVKGLLCQPLNACANTYKCILLERETILLVNGVRAKRVDKLSPRCLCNPIMPV